MSFFGCWFGTVSLTSSPILPRGRVKESLKATSRYNFQIVTAKTLNVLRFSGRYNEINTGVAMIAGIIDTQWSGKHVFASFHSAGLVG